MFNKLEMFAEMALADPQRSLFIYRTPADLGELNQALGGKAANILRVTSLNELPQTPCIALWITSAKELSESWAAFDGLNDLSILMVALKEDELNELDDDAQDEILHSFAPIFKY